MKYAIYYRTELTSGVIRNNKIIETIRFMPGVEVTEELLKKIAFNLARIHAMKTGYGATVTEVRLVDPIEE